MNAGPKDYKICYVKGGWRQGEGVREQPPCHERKWYMSSREMRQAAVTPKASRRGHERTAHLSDVKVRGERVDAAG